MNEEDVVAALKALAEHDRELEAPPQVEVHLRQTFRSTMGGRHSWRRAGFLAGLSVAAAIVIMLGAVYFRSKPTPQVQAIADSTKIAQPAPEPIRIAGPAPVVKAAAHTPRRPAPPREVVTDFFPLVEIAPPLDRAALVRINLPATAMRTVGLPVREDRLFDRVNADVLVSEEGVATAIRFVKYQ